MKMSKMVFLGVMIFCGSIIMAEENLLGSSELKKESGWGCWYDANAQKAGVKAEFANGAFTLNTPAGLKKDVNGIQLTRKIELESGVTYQIAFSATAKKEGTIKVAYILNDSPWSTYCITDIKITPNMKNYSCKLKPENFGKDFEKEKSLRFFLGGLADNTICIENVEIKTVK